MLTILSILASSNLAGFFLILRKLIKINRLKAINQVEPIKNKKWRKVLIYLLISCVSFFILSVTLFISFYLSKF